MDTTPNPCPNCPELLKRLAALEELVRDLNGQLSAGRKKSASTSKQPASVIVKQKLLPRRLGL